MRVRGNIFYVRCVGIAAGTLISGTTVKRTCRCSRIVVYLVLRRSIACFIDSTEGVPTCCGGQCRTCRVGAPSARAGILDLTIGYAAGVGCSILNRFVRITTIANGSTRGVCNLTNWGNSIQVNLYGACALISITCVEIPPTIVS